MADTSLNFYGPLSQPGDGGNLSLDFADEFILATNLVFSNSLVITEIQPPIVLSTTLSYSLQGEITDSPYLGLLLTSLDFTPIIDVTELIIGGEITLSFTNTLTIDDAISAQTDLTFSPGLAQILENIPFIAGSSLVFSNDLAISELVGNLPTDITFTSEVAGITNLVISGNTDLTFTPTISGITELLPSISTSLTFSPGLTAIEDRLGSLSSNLTFNLGLSEITSAIVLQTSLTFHSEINYPLDDSLLMSTSLGFTSQAIISDFYFGGSTDLTFTPILKIDDGIHAATSLDFEHMYVYITDADAYVTSLKFILEARIDEYIEFIGNLGTTLSLTTNISEVIDEVPFVGETSLEMHSSLFFTDIYDIVLTNTLSFESSLTISDAGQIQEQDLTLRLVKGTRLTHEEMDGNYITLLSRIPHYRDDINYPINTVISHQGELYSARANLIAGLSPSLYPTVWERKSRSDLFEASDHTHSEHADVNHVHGQYASSWHLHNNSDLPYNNLGVVSGPVNIDFANLKQMLTPNGNIDLQLTMPIGGFHKTTVCIIPSTNITVTYPVSNNLQHGVSGVGVTNSPPPTNLALGESLILQYETDSVNAFLTWKKAA